MGHMVDYFRDHSLALALLGVAAVLGFFLLLMRHRGRGWSRSLLLAACTCGLFRHWLLGFGSGDLLVKPAGVNAQPFEMHNVLFVEKKLRLIQQMLQTREVVRSA